MHLGSLRVRLFLRESRSLKDKRQVVRSIKDRMRAEYNVAAAEVEALDHRQMIVLGFAAVGAEASLVRTTLDAVLRNVRIHPIAEFIDHEMDC